MKIIIEGNSSEVNKIVKENAVRVRRGLIAISPLSEESEDVNPIIDDEHPVIDEDKKTIIDDDKKAVIDEDKKTPKKSGGKGKKVIED